mgnify:CR=1 FL=1
MAYTDIYLFICGLGESKDEKKHFHFSTLLPASAFNT